MIHTLPKHWKNRTFLAEPCVMYSGLIHKVATFVVVVVSQWQNIIHKYGIFLDIWVYFWIYQYVPEVLIQRSSPALCYEIKSSNTHLKFMFMFIYPDGTMSSKTSGDVSCVIVNAVHACSGATDNGVPTHVSWSTSAKGPMLNQGLF